MIGHHDNYKGLKVHSVDLINFILIFFIYVLIQLPVGVLVKLLGHRHIKFANMVVLLTLCQIGTNTLK